MRHHASSEDGTGAVRDLARNPNRATISVAAFEEFETLMTDGLIAITDEQAKLAQEIVKAFRGLGSFLERALGSTPEDLVGYLGGDWLHIRRVESIIKILYKTRERLAAIGNKETKPAPLSVALPILQGAADEDREELVDLWTRLLASAMDPATRNNVRQAFIAAVREMDPPDAKIMHHLYVEQVTRIRRGGGGDRKDTSTENISNILGDRRDDVELSIEHLEGLGFLSTLPNNDKNMWFPNAKLREFMRACYPELGRQV